jgi:hypothetical protein
MRVEVFSKATQPTAAAATACVVHVKATAWLLMASGVLPGVTLPSGAPMVLIMMSPLPRQWLVCG